MTDFHLKRLAYLLYLIYCLLFSRLNSSSVRNKSTPVVRHPHQNPLIYPHPFFLRARKACGWSHGIMRPAFFIWRANIGSVWCWLTCILEWPLSGRPHLGPCCCQRGRAALDWWRSFSDEAVFITPVQNCAVQMDCDHPSSARDTSVPCVA